MERTDRSGKKLKIYAEEWNGASTDTQAPVLVLVHGFGEHLGRYRSIFERLKDPFVKAIAYDLRGHGRSQGTRGHVERFDDHIEDFEYVVRQVAERHGRPVFVLGHSMGGAIVLQSLLKSGLRTNLAAAAVSSPYLKLAMDLPPAKVAAAKVLLRLLPNLQLSVGLNPSHLSHVPQIVEAYVHDRLVHDKITPQMYCELETAVQNIREQTGPMGCPVLFLIAGDDRLVDAEATRSFYAQLKHRQKEWVEFPEMFHEIFNEDKHEQVDRAFLSWVSRILDRAQRKKKVYEYANEK